MLTVVIIAICFLILSILIFFFFYQNDAIFLLWIPCAVVAIVMGIVGGIGLWGDVQVRNAARKGGFEITRMSGMGLTFETRVQDVRYKCTVVNGEVQKCIKFNEPLTAIDLLEQK